MSETLIFVRQPLRPLEPPTAPIPVPSRRFATSVEVLETARASEAPLLSIINAVLAKDTASPEELLALRARLRRYSSEVNLLMSLLRALSRDLKR